MKLDFNGFRTIGQLIKLVDQYLVLLLAKLPNDSTLNILPVRSCLGKKILALSRYLRCPGPAARAVTYRNPAIANHGGDGAIQGCPVQFEFFCYPNQGFSGSPGNASENFQLCDVDPRICQSSIIDTDENAGELLYCCTGTQDCAGLIRCIHIINLTHGWPESLTCGISVYSDSDRTGNFRDA